MVKGLAVSDIVNVTVNLSPLAAAYRNFGATIIVGDSDVIDTTERMRQYSQLEEVTVDFGTTSPEYFAADLFFSQTPQNDLLYMGRWARVATHGELHGAILTPMQMLLSNFTAITDGSFHITIDGVTHDITGIDLSGALNLNGVASRVQTALAATYPGVQVKWVLNEERFTIYSPSTGIESSVSWATAAATGTDISNLFGWRNTVNTPQPIIGVAGETPVACVASLTDLSADWYCLIFAASTQPTDSDYIAVSGLIEGQGVSRIHGITTQETGTLDPTIEADLASEMKSLGYNRTFMQYSSNNPYAVASLWARQSTVNFEANNTTLTLKFKQEPGVVAEWITETWAATLKKKHCNVFVHYQNDTAIIQEGVMSGGYFIDERVGADWLQNAIQTDVFNLLYQAPTKIPQTDAGMNMIKNTINRTCERAVNNGWSAPGVWNVAGFGQLNMFDTLETGYYVFAPPVATQAPADREARKSVAFQVAIKLAGAVHSSNILVTVNR